MKRTALLFHIALWLVLILNALWIALDNYATRYGLDYVFIKTSVTEGIFLSLFYIHYGLLVPRLLHQKRWTVYLLSIVLLTSLSVAGQWWLYRLLGQLQEVDIGGFEWAYAVYFGLNGLTYLLLSGLAWYTWHGIKWSQKNERLEKEKVKAQLQALTAKVNPHFLFNTLNNIYVLVRQKKEGADQAVLDLSGLMRYMLEGSEADQVSLVSELKMMRDYLALQSLRLEEGFLLEVDFPETLNPDIKVAPLLFVPLLENAFKHGDLSKEGFIKLRLSLDEKGICWRSENLIDPNQEPHGTGLKNLRQRLQLLFGEQYELSAEAKDRVFETKMCIAL